MITTPPECRTTKWVGLEVATTSHPNARSAANNSRFETRAPELAICSSDL
jgi:hypothetical protein